ncbi:hypothetical protein, partial [Oleiphilus sp. HI0079]|uniref:hypothetical protein n=1 Tax=Oleiphilus sp. HI0079 TaxID=1822254 RepID=UPI001E61A69D
YRGGPWYFIKLANRAWFIEVCSIKDNITSSSTGLRNVCTFPAKHAAKSPTLLRAVSWAF